jgi:uncharacterized glyoxalase superfamily protein PhnB
MPALRVPHVGGLQETTMLDATTSARANVMPCLTYRDAPAAIEFLCRAFGFEKKMVVPGDNNTIAHAELTLGNAMVMLGSVKDTGYGRLVKPPRDLGFSTQTTYIVVPEADAHCARAKAAGAEMCSTSSPRTMAAATTPAAIPRDTCGRSAPTILGRRSQPRVRTWRCYAARPLPFWSRR